MPWGGGGGELMSYKICDLLCNLGLLDKDDDLRASHELMNTERIL